MLVFTMRFEVTLTLSGTILFLPRNSYSVFCVGCVLAHRIWHKIC